MQIAYVKGLDLSPQEIEEAQKRYSQALESRPGNSHSRGALVLKTSLSIQSHASIFLAVNVFAS